MKIKLILILSAVILSSCKDETNEIMTDLQTSNPPDILGMDFTQSKITFDETYTVLKNSLEANTNISIVAEVNHSQNALSVDLILNPTRIIFFGNPNLGTPLMQKNQLAGLDLPQKIMVYQNDSSEVYAGFNNTIYLTNRHNLEAVTTLPMIQSALTNLSTGASQDTLSIAKNNDVMSEEGIISKTVTGTLGESYMRLRTAIENNPNLRIIAELDHQANAASVGMELNPTRIIIFGNPNLGTPLMQNTQTTALDLPQKMLIWTDAEDITHVSYNDPAFLVTRHGITENESTLETITSALNTLSNVAAEAQ